MKRPLALLTVLAVGVGALAAAVSACADDTSSTAAPDESTDAATEAQRPPLPGADAATGADAAHDASTCEITRAYHIACNTKSGDPLAEFCGSAKFDAYCASNDGTNSESYRRAEALCLVKENCDGLDRRDCEYRSYATATPTAAQKQVVLAYCQTCEPGDPTGCVKRKTAYDPQLGPKSTDDVFVAAWELSDALDDAIRTQCTGSALDAGAVDAGADAASCLKAFANCAGGIYLDALHDCPP